MNFTRTNSGLSNSAAFHGVDYMVYSEGGEYDSDLECSRWAIDVVFWKSIFSKYLPGLRYKLKPMGSKENVKPFVDKIISSSITCSIAVMDRDHDAHKNCMVRHPCVLYTYGYSWENDAWQAEVIISKLKRLSPSQDISREIEDNIRLRWNNFNTDFRRLVFVDILCSIKSVQGVDRVKFWGYVDKADKSRIKVKKEKMKLLIQRAKSNCDKPFKYIGSHVVSSERDCYGKLLAMFAYELFCDAYREITGAKNLARFDADIMLAEHIEIFAMSNMAPEMDRHYSRKVLELGRFLQV